LGEEGLTDDMRHHSRTLAQRFYELSAEQGSASSELRLGDYSYYGWGMSATFKEDQGSSDETPQGDDEGSGGSEAVLPNLYTSSEVELHPQVIDYEASLARYRKTAEMPVTGEWMQGFVARGSFNLGFMHQFGLGVTQDLQTAKQHYHRCREVDPSGLHTPVTMVLLALGTHMTFLRLPTWPILLERLFVDMRVHLLVLHLVGILTLVVIQCVFVRSGGARGEGGEPRPGQQPAAAAQPAPAAAARGREVGAEGLHQRRPAVENLEMH